MAAGLGALAVLGSLFMPWYQIGASLNGNFGGFTMSALAAGAGGWRWIILGCSLAVLLEVALGVLVDIGATEWPHRQVLALLSLLNLVLVIAGFLSSPINHVLGDLGAVLGIHSQPGAGAFLGLAGAVVGAAASIGRLLASPPALARRPGTT